MDTIPTALLVIAAAFAWVGVTVFFILRARGRRSGSTLVRSAASSTALSPGSA